MIAAECPLIAGNSAKTVSSSVTILMIVVQAMVAVAALRLILRDGSSLCAFRSLPLLGRVPAIRARGVVASSRCFVDPR